MNALPTPSPESLPELQAAFLAVLPRIRVHARIRVGHVRCLEHRADCLAEVEALCWLWFVRLARRGREPWRFASALAGYAARAVRSGRRLCGQLPAKDALSERAQRRGGFRAEPLQRAERPPAEAHTGSGRPDDPMAERLRDNTRAPVPEQAAFRCDFPAWLGTRSARDRRLIRDMLRNERTTDLARKYRISPARVSQLRRAYREHWQRFGELPEPPDAGCPEPFATSAERV